MAKYQWYHPGTLQEFDGSQLSWGRATGFDSFQIRNQSPVLVVLEETELSQLGIGQRL
jgi:hypothetical protein